MLKFRGQKYYTDKWITGYLTSKDHIDGEWIKPETLSISTGKHDSTNAEIFASFEVDGKMTEGGDVVECNRIKYDVFYNQILSYFMMKSAKHTLPIGETYTIGNITIIGKQGGGE